MILLAVDTSGKNGSIALVRVSMGADKSNYGLETLEVLPLEGGTFSAQLVPQIATMLTRHGFNKSEIAGFAAVSGPGSFTGLRVGLAAIKALAEVLCKPIAAVSLLEAVAQSGEARGKVVAALDAGRGEIYAGQYEVSVEADAQCLREQLVLPAELAGLAAGCPVITPDEKLAMVGQSHGLSVESIPYPRSDVIARIGWKRIAAGRTISPEDLEANYIRRSDAEIFAKIS